MLSTLEVRTLVLGSAMLAASCDARATDHCDRAPAAEALRQAIDARAVVRAGGTGYVAAKVGPVPGPALEASVQAADLRVEAAARAATAARACGLRSSG